MKNIIIFAMALAGTFSYGSHTVCSAPNLYYSATRGDFGTQPPKGTTLGNLTIFSKGSLLVNQDYIQGGNQVAAPKFGVTFAGPQVVLSKTGAAGFGSLVFKDTAILYTVAPNPIAEILRTPVVCEQTWALVP